MDVRTVSRSGSTVREFDIDDAMSLYPDGTEHVIVLNSSARRIWQLLDECRTECELVDRIAEEHQLEPATIADEVGAALDVLAAQGLVTLRS